MTYVVPRAGKRYELRESYATPDGPRSRTLAGFKTLTPEVIEQALERSDGSLSAAEIRAATRRAGAPVTREPADAAAATLLAELSAGARPSRALARLLSHELGAASGEPPSDAERAAAPWLSATPQERGEALRDLLLLADRLPAPSRKGRPRSPVIRTAPG